MVLAKAIDREVSAVECKNRFDPFAFGEVHQTSVGELRAQIFIPRQKAGNPRGGFRAKWEQFQKSNLETGEHPLNGGNILPEQPRAFGSVGRWFLVRKRARRYRLSIGTHALTECDPQLFDPLTFPDSSRFYGQFQEFRAGFRAKTEQRLAQDGATLEVCDTGREPVFKRRGTGAFSQ